MREYHSSGEKELLGERPASGREQETTHGDECGISFERPLVGALQVLHLDHDEPELLGGGADSRLVRSEQEGTDAVDGAAIPRSGQPRKAESRDVARTQMP